MNCYYFGDERVVISYGIIKMFRGHCNRRVCRLSSGCDWLDTLTQQYPIVWVKENAIYHHIICADYEPSYAYAHCCFPANFFACGGGTAVIETTQAHQLLWRKRPESKGEASS